MTAPHARTPGRAARGQGPASGPGGAAEVCGHHLDSRRNGRVPSLGTVSGRHALRGRRPSRLRLQRKSEGRPAWTPPLRERRGTDLAVSAVSLGPRHTYSMRRRGVHSGQDRGTLWASTRLLCPVPLAGRGRAVPSALGLLFLRSKNVVSACLAVSASCALWVRSLRRESRLPDYF